MLLVIAIRKCTGYKICSAESGKLLQCIYNGICDALCKRIGFFCICAKKGYLVSYVRKNIFVTLKDVFQYFLKFFDRMLLLMKDKLFYYVKAFYHISHLLELLAICTSLYTDKEKDNLKPNIPATLQNVINFVQENFSENIQIEDIAAAAKCSTSYLSKIFKNIWASLHTVI